MSALREHPYASFVQRVQKPARYLGGEHGAIVKDWASVKSTVCLAFPDVYDIGMSHLGFKILYDVLNKRPDMLAERAYAPWVDMEKEIRDRGLPLVSAETARPLVDFDVVGFSLQFELTYTNVLLMLDLGGIPLRAADRTEAHPLVIAGGPTATHPEPIVDFLDAIVIGDGEERTTEVALLWSELKAAGVPRAERLVRLSALRGVYVPSLYGTVVDPDTGIRVVDRALDARAPLPVQRNLLDDLNKFPFPATGPVGGPEAIFDRMSIEIARGCTEGCRFCQAGMIYRPVRERDPDVIVETLAEAVDKSGYDEVSLTALSTADFSCIAPLIQKVTERLAPDKVSLGVSSLRAYGLDEPVLDDIKRVRASGITFAPEAGSQRMRDVVNKNVTEEQLMTTAERVFSRGWDSMKLYFMIGLPTEEEEDVREIVRVGARARHVGKQTRKAHKLGGAPKVVVSVSTHVPKPHTPFQWCAMDPHDQVVEKQGWLKDEVRPTGVDLRMHESRTSWLEGVFARGDRSLCNVLERAYRAGARFDSWQDQLKMEAWEEAFEAEGVSPATFLGTIPVTARLPWDHIDMGLEDGFLLREYRKALKSRLSPPCGKAAGMFVHHPNLEAAKADTRKLVCYDCGVACDLTAMRKDRLVALGRLGAEKPRVVAPRALPVVQAPPPPPPPPVVVAAPEAADGASEVEAAPAPAKPAKPKGKKPPPMVVQGEGRRVRLVFAKTGPTAYLSHLDLLRALPRSFRRVKVPLFYTSGYHPKPDFVFGPALSLGVAALGEVFDAKIVSDVDPAELVQALSEASAGGLDFVAGVRLGPDDAVCAKIVRGARYALGVPRSALGGLGGDAFVREAVARFHASDSVVHMRRIEGLGKKVDVKRFVRGVVADSERAAASLARAGIVGDLLPVEVDVFSTNEGGVKIAEVAEALFGASPSDPGETRVPYRAVRAQLGLWGDDGALVLPTDLERLRPITLREEAEAKEARRAARAEREAEAAAAAARTLQAHPA